MEQDKPDPETGLTPKEITLVQESWAPFKNDLKSAGVEMFLIFFKHTPEYQNYFPFRGTPYDELQNDEKFKAHATNVIYNLCAAIDNLSNKYILLNLLANVGKSHSKRKVPEKSYWDLKLSIMELLQNHIGDTLTPELESAWDNVLEVAMKVVAKELTNPSPDE